MKIKWIPFDGSHKLPPERKAVLVQLSQVRGYGVGAVAVGYLRYAAGDKDCPFFVTPGVKRTNDYYLPEIPKEDAEVTHWADCFGNHFECPGWPGTHQGSATRSAFQGHSSQLYEIAAVKKEKLWD